MEDGEDLPMGRFVRMFSPTSASACKFAEMEVEGIVYNIDTVDIESHFCDVSI